MSPKDERGNADSLWDELSGALGSGENEPSPADVRRYLDWAVELAREGETPVEKGHILAHIAENVAREVGQKGTSELLEEALRNLRQRQPGVEESADERLCGLVAVSTAYRALGNSERAIEAVGAIETDGDVLAESLPEPIRERFSGLQGDFLPEMGHFIRGIEYAEIALHTQSREALRLAKSEYRSMSSDNPIRDSIAEKIAIVYHLRDDSDECFSWVERLAEDYPIRKHIAHILATEAALSNDTSGVLRAAALVADKEDRARLLAQLYKTLSPPQDVLSGLLGRLFTER